MNKLENLFKEVFGTNWGSIENSKKVIKIVDKINNFWIKKIKKEYKKIK